MSKAYMSAKHWSYLFFSLVFLIGSLSMSNNASVSGFKSPVMTVFCLFLVALWFSSNALLAWSSKFPPKVTDFLWYQSGWARLVKPNCRFQKTSLLFKNFWCLNFRLPFFVLNFSSSARFSLSWQFSTATFFVVFWATSKRLFIGNNAGKCD